MLSSHWEPKLRSKKCLEGSEEEGDEIGGDGEAVAQPTSPASPRPSQVGELPVRTPQKGDQEDDLEEFDPYMAWTLGGEMLPPRPPVSPTPSNESVQLGNGNPDQQQEPHGEDDEMEVEDVEEQLKKLEFLVCNRLVSFGDFTFQLWCF